MVEIRAFVDKLKSFTGTLYNYEGTWNVAKT